MKQLSENDDIFIHRTSGQNSGKLEDILFTGFDGQMHKPCLRVVLEAGAELTLIERHGGQGLYEKGMKTVILLEEGACLFHYRFQEDSPLAMHKTGLSVSLGKEAVYESFILTRGAKSSQYDVNVDLNGEGAQCHIKEIKTLINDQQGDMTLFLNHNVPDCSSSLECRSVLDGTAKGLFSATTYVAKGAYGTKADQLSKAILISDRAEMRAKPELRIYADDVKCSHGATMGQLDMEQLFYLRCRGIPEDVARALLVEAFLGDLVGKIVDKTVKAEILFKIGGNYELAI